MTSLPVDAQAPFGRQFKAPKRLRTVSSVPGRLLMSGTSPNSPRSLGEP